MRSHTTLDSPVGPLTLVALDGRLAGVYLDGHRHTRAPDLGERDDDALPQAREQLGEWFAGQRRDFDLPLAAHGTPFQARVWQALRAVPYATTCTYGDLAAAVGSPAAVRAVGSANARNPLSIVVPCHRVVGAGGALTGYAGGLERKRALLALEASVAGGTLAG